MIIGTFTQNPAGGYVGRIDTAGLNLTDVVFEKRETGVNFALSAEHHGQTFEVGAAWQKSGEFGDYLSVKLDSPLFIVPINATMKLKGSDAGVFALRWNRRKDEE